MTLERADWHWDSAEKQYREKNNCSGALTDEQQWEIWLKAANHIGLFLWWIIDRGFEGENLDAGECDMVRNGQMTGTEFFMRYCYKMSRPNVQKILYKNVQLVCLF